MDGIKADNIIALLQILWKSVGIGFEIERPKSLVFSYFKKYERLKRSEESKGSSRKNILNVIFS